MKFSPHFILAGLLLGATGCAHVDVVAPHGPAVYLFPPPRRCQWSGAGEPGFWPGALRQ